MKKSQSKTIKISNKCIQDVHKYIADNDFKSVGIIARHVGISREECASAIEQLLEVGQIAGNKRYVKNF